MISHNKWILQSIINNIGCLFLLLLHFLPSNLANDISLRALKNSFSVLKHICSLFLNGVSSLDSLLFKGFFIFFIYFVYLFDDFFNGLCGDWGCLILDSGFGRVEGF